MATLVTNMPCRPLTHLCLEMGWFFRIACCLCLLTIASDASAQDTAQFGLKLESTALVNRTADAQSYVATNRANFDVRHNRYAADATAAYIYGANRAGLTNNDFTAGATGNRYGRRSRRIYAWGLASYESLFALRVPYRVQAGGGIAWSPVDNETAYINLSNGPIYERSRITLADSSVQEASIIRNSFRLRFRFAAKENLVVLEGTHTLQTSVRDISDYIVRSRTSLTAALWKGIGFTAVADYNQTTATARETLLLTLGLRYELRF